LTLEPLTSDDSHNDVRPATTDVGVKPERPAGRWPPPAAPVIALRMEGLLTWTAERVANRIPDGRETAFALGLDAGLAGDFFTAAHILIPQFEHALRWHLGQRDVVTVTFPQSGVQNALDLNAILDLPAITTILDEATLFDLKNLLTEKAGANLRNELAHGLIEPGTHGHDFVYFWWVVLRFVLLPLLNPRPAGEGTVVKDGEVAP